MKKMYYVCLLGLAVNFGILAAAIDATNNVAIAILSYASMDNEDDLDVDTDYPVRYTDWNGLLDAVNVSGLSRSDKDAALFNYLMRQSTNDLSRVDGEVRELIRVGLCECRDLNHTNIFPVVRNLLMNPTASYMDEHVYLYYKWASIGEDFLVVTRSFLSNTSLVARAGRSVNLLDIDNSINRHKKVFGGDVWFTNAVNLVYQLRGSCPESAEVLDGMLLSKISGYEYSSNRLETVRAWIDSAKCTSEGMAYCVSVTNRLMNAPHPLQLVESLRGL